MNSSVPQSTNKSAAQSTNRSVQQSTTQSRIRVGSIFWDTPLKTSYFEFIVPGTTSSVLQPMNSSAQQSMNSSVQQLTNRSVQQSMTQSRFRFKVLSPIQYFCIKFPIGRDSIKNTNKMIYCLTCYCCFTSLIYDVL